MKKRKINKYVCAGICVCALLALPIIANAIQYSTYNINVKDEYEYVDMTPQVIYTKSNMPVPDNIFTWATTWDFNYYTIVLWVKINGIFTPIDQYTFNDYNGDFGMGVSTYKKHPWDITYFWKFTGIVDYTEDLTFPFEGSYKVFIEIKGSVTYWYLDMTFETIPFKISGLSNKFTVED